MAEIKQTREQLERRRDEINKQLNRVNQICTWNSTATGRQAIEVEHNEVSTSRSESAKELNAIEDKLLDSK